MASAVYLGGDFAEAIAINPSTGATAVEQDGQRRQHPRHA